MNGLRINNYWTSSLLVLVSTGLALLAAEYGLRWQRAQIEASSQMDAGLLRYDANLGWGLNPLWRGRHRHHDFDVEYSTDLDAWRTSPDSVGKVPGQDVFWVGDSFTFGLGVGDGDTFVNRLNRSQPGVRHVNAGIPGFSTDQEMLLVEQRVLRTRPGAVVLVVYLGNDLFDNRLPFPIQAENAKPYFSLDDAGALVSHQLPVPRLRKPTDGSQPTLAEMTLGESASSVWAPIYGLELVRRLGLVSEPHGMGRVDGRYADELALFAALLTRLHKAVADAGVRFQVVLLPSRRAVEQADGAMADVQDYLAGKILELAQAQGVTTLSLIPVLRAAQAAEPGSLFFPNEGHLTVQGHDVVARALTGLVSAVSGE
ncbi:MAG: SGNH/GDSL hydrolase family protein [Rhodocyclaceae bacterium]|nr:SGNH/GDSL hydrolase family protein [Gammaproteobacteria bacterium]MCB1962895.1 SGNH/GDSL hydrolase family protein [Rhodocyclaceae bacterium]MCP5138122.1 SGNH/GDSL hydrolase family protein [Gammaproteobacteria bacterium]